MRDIVSVKIMKEVENKGYFIKIAKGKKREEIKGVIIKGTYNRMVEINLKLSVTTKKVSWLTHYVPSSCIQNNYKKLNWAINPLMATLE